VELLGNDVCPGIDYVMSEVVHCKSHKEIGVKEALPECGKRYLKRVVTQSGARVVVGFGKFAADAVHQVFDIPDAYSDETEQQFRFKMISDSS
jgi:hypothetical protein